MLIKVLVEMLIDVRLYMYDTFLQNKNLTRQQIIHV